MFPRNLFQPQPEDRKLKVLSTLAGIILVAFAVAGRPGQARAAAWPQPRGNGYLKISYGTASANEQFGFDGGTKPIVDGLSDYPFADRSFYIYAEYGLTERVTVIGLVPFKRVFVHDRLFRYRTTGLGDAAGGLRWRAWSGGPWVASLSGSASIPTGYHRDTQPPLGSGRVDLTGAVEVGRSFYPLPAYAVGIAGYRYRSSLALSTAGRADGTVPATPAATNYADQFVYQAEAGWNFLRRIDVSAQVRGVHALKADRNGFSITSIPTAERYLKVGGGASVRVVPRLALGAEVFTTAAGRSTARSIDVSLGASTTW